MLSLRSFGIKFLIYYCASPLSGESRSFYNNLDPIHKSQSGGGFIFVGSDTVSYVKSRMYKTFFVKSWRGVFLDTGTGTGTGIIWVEAGNASIDVKSGYRYSDLEDFDTGTTQIPTLHQDRKSYRQLPWFIQGSGSGQKDPDPTWQRSGSPTWILAHHTFISALVPGRVVT
jgi:hypothetical protein